MGNAFVHIELNTDNVGKAKKFYQSLFQWKMGPMGPDYTGIDVGTGTGTGGGMQEKMPGAPAMWIPYVAVDDVKKTVAKAKKLGAKVHVDFLQIGDMGSIGVFSDPSGATLGVWAIDKKAAKKAAAKPAKKTAKKPAKKSAKKK